MNSRSSELVKIDRVEAELSRSCFGCTLHHTKNRYEYMKYETLQASALYLP